MDTTTKDYPPAYSEPRGVFISWRLVGYVSVAVIAIGLSLLLNHLMRGSDSERGVRLLIEAFSNRRMIEPRLSGGFKGGAFNPPLNAEAEINSEDVAYATELIENAVDSSNPYSHLAYGRMLLSKGGKGTDALKHLQLAVAELPEKAEPYNDLGVCLMEQGDLEGALEEFNLALSSKVDMTEALFNRGLCYERLFLRDAASDDYRRLLEIERDQSWAGEIRRRHEETSALITPAKQQAEIIKAFDAAIADGRNDEVKNLINNNLEVLTKHACRDYALEYLRAVEAGNQSESDRVYSKLLSIGGAFSANYKDTSIAELTGYLKNLPDGERETEIKLISEFHEADKYNYLTESQATLEKLKNIFEARQNYFFEFLSTFSLSLGDFNSGHFKSSVSKLEQCRALLSNHNWPYRQSLIELHLGNIYSRGGQDALAVRYCIQAIEHCNGAPLIESKTLQFMANAYWHLGDIKTGLDCLRKSTFLVLTYAPQFGELSNNSLQIADFCRILGNSPLALLYAKQALSLAEQGESNKLIAQANSFIAVERARQKQVEGVDEGMKRAFEYVEKIDSKESTYTKSLVLTRAGEIAARRVSFEPAVQYYSQAEAVIEQSQEKIIPMLSVLRGRASVYTQTKDYTKARQDLVRASRFIEDYRKNITDQKNRSDFLDASQSVFDDLMLLNAKVFANQQEAFNISEKSRARTLLDGLSYQQSASNQNNTARPPNKNSGGTPANPSVNPLTLAEVQKALPDDLRLVTYSVTSQGTFIFLVTHGGFDSAQSPATAEMLDQMVQDYLSSIRRIAPLDEVSEKARELYRFLIKPIEGRLGDGKQLCIVPDKALHYLPFAALVDESGKYLVNSYRLTYAPSASMLIRCLAEARIKGKNRAEKILAVGNPSFSKAMFPNLDELLDAEREADLSATFYKESVVLNKDKATRQQVRKELMDCDIAHLSLHCLVEEKTPWLAALVLAEPQPGEDDHSTGNNGLLYLSEIYGMSLPRTRLVILSACESGLGQYYRGEGIVSLVRPFLALKVPTVIATLWSVDSQATAELMIDFHREYKAHNFGAGDALRNAQLNMVKITSYQHPYYWAPFIMVGSNN
ncbi:MAG: CHAT domain-containing protein [Blastocatellia bacterium]